MSHGPVRDTARGRGGPLSAKEKRRILAMHDRACSVKGPPPHGGTCSLRGIARQAGHDRETVQNVLAQRAKGRGTKEVHGDPELGPHGRELFYFGQNLRDHLRVSAPDVRTEPPGTAGSPITWAYNRDVLVSEPNTSNPERDAVDRSWVDDARNHQLFAAFRQHLSDCQCWAILERVEGDARSAGKAWERLYQAILKTVAERLPRLAAQDVTALVRSLFADAVHRGSGYWPFSFSYEPERSHISGAEGWQLVLGAFRTFPVADQRQLEPLIAVHQELRTTLPYGPEVDDFVVASNKASESVRQFKDALSPDALLRKLVLQGHCNLCP